MTPLPSSRLVAAVLAFGLGGVEARLGGGQAEEAGSARQAPPALCAEALVQETCKLFGEEGDSATPVAVAELLSATPEAVAALWAAVALSEGAAAPCDALCHGTTALLSRLGRTLPPASDTGCYYDVAGELACDLDLSPSAIGRMANSSRGDLPLTDGVAAMGVPEGNMTAKEEAMEPKVFAYSTEDVAARVAQLFRIYPALGAGGLAVDDLPASKGGAEISPALLERRLGESIAYVNLAIRTFPAHGTRPEVRLFFGEAATTEKTSRQKILSVLNSIGNVLGYSRFVGHGEMCSPNTFGYVVPCRNDPEERDSSGRFMIYLCNMFWSTQNEQICTLVHEASHHATACTKDIIYGARQCKALAQGNPKYALFNADNYGYYIREVAKNRGTL